MAKNNLTEEEKKKIEELRKRFPQCRIETDDVAVPEVHLYCSVKTKKCYSDEKDILFEDTTPAVPEVHLKKDDKRKEEHE